MRSDAILISGGFDEVVGKMALIAKESSRQPRREPFRKVEERIPKEATPPGSHGQKAPVPPDAAKKWLGDRRCYVCRKP